MSEEEIINNIKTRLLKLSGNSLDRAVFNIADVEELYDLYNKEKEEKEKFKKALGKRITYCNELEKDLFENCSNYVISKDKIRNFFEERLLKYTEADDGKYDKPYLTRGELELVDRYGECKEIAEILLAEKIELPKECIRKDKIREKIKEVENGKEKYIFERLTSEDIRRTIITNLEELLEE